MKIIFFLICFAFTSSLFSKNTIILKNGKSIKGLVVAQDDKTLTYKDEKNKETKILKKTILKVVFKDLDEAEVKRVKAEEERKIKEREKALALEQSLKQKEAERLAEEERQREEFERIEQERLSFEKEQERLRLEELERNSRSKYSVVWRSALVPGWGQYYAGNTNSGIVYASLFYASLGYALSENAKIPALRSNYENAQFFDFILRSSYLNSLSTTNVPDFSLNFVIQNQVSNTLIETISNSENSKEQLQRAQGRVLAAGFVAGMTYLINIFSAFSTGKAWAEEPTQDKPQSFYFNFNPSIGGRYEAGFRAQF